MTVIDPVSLGIMWDRLISITDEVLSALVRTSFSSNVRDSYDLSVLLFSANGMSLAQGTYSVPSFTGTGPATLRHMQSRFPPDALRPGDVIATNDPWLGTGHLYDINVMAPVFRRGRLVGYSMSITHLPDIGGRGFSATGRSVYEEGLRLPVGALVRAGEPNHELLELIRTNVRVPDHVVGDLNANITCTPRAATSCAPARRSARSSPEAAASATRVSGRPNGCWTTCAPALSASTARSATTASWSTWNASRCPCRVSPGTRSTRGLPSPLASLSRLRLAQPSSLVWLAT